LSLLIISFTITAELGFLVEFVFSDSVFAWVEHPANIDKKKAIISRFLIAAPWFATLLPAYLSVNKIYRLLASSTCLLTNKAIPTLNKSALHSKYGKLST